ncbi:MAG: glycoside hydrolase family 5 protein [Polyangia bacterium]|nr:glycoside hydrolase family 5 protein [Polyangia bacterium]
MSRLLPCSPLLLALLGAPSCTDAEPNPPRLYQVEDGLMRDSSGHALLLRGVNVSGEAKSAPDHLFDLTAADLDTLLSSGVNSVRLLAFWNAIAPDAPGVIDETYLAAFRQRVDLLAAAGLYVVVDMHQDLWGEPFAPHGAPAWACPEELTQGYEPQSPWWLNYTTPQVRGCFDRFWASPELQQAFIAAWIALASSVCHEELVLGFDLMNEPYPGSALVEAEWDNEVLLPFHLRVADAIDAVCPGRLHFIEPSAAYVLGMANPIRIPEGERHRLVYAGHFYPTAVHEPGTEGYDGDATALAREFDELFGPYLDSGVAVWIGEWGGITTNPGFSSYVDDAMTIFAARNVSTALWDYYRGEGGFAFLGPSGLPKPEFEAAYGTPTPTRLPGPPAVAFHPGERQVEATFRCVPGRGATLLLPDGDCACEAVPTSALGPFPQGPGFATATCMAEAEVSLTCSCPH